MEDGLGSARGGRTGGGSPATIAEVMEFAEADITEGSLQTEDGDATSAIAAAAAATVDAGEDEVGRELIMWCGGGCA